MAWFGKDEKTRAALDRFHKLVDSEERLVIAVTYSSVKSIEHKFDAAADENRQSQKDILEKMDQLSAEVTGKSKHPTLESTLFLTAAFCSSRRHGRRPAPGRSLDARCAQNADRKSVV